MFVIRNELLLIESLVTHSNQWAMLARVLARTNVVEDILGRELDCLRKYGVAGWNAVLPAEHLEGGLCRQRLVRRLDCRKMAFRLVGVEWKGIIKTEIAKEKCSILRCASAAKSCPRPPRTFIVVSTSGANGWLFTRSKPEARMTPPYGLGFCRKSMNFAQACLGRGSVQPKHIGASSLSRYMLPIRRTSSRSGFQLHLS